MRTRVRAGESSAFAELYDSYARTVYNHAFRLTADWATAEDVMAATFMEARVMHVPGLRSDGRSGYRPELPSPAAVHEAGRGNR